MRRAGRSFDEGPSPRVGRPGDPLRGEHLPRGRHRESVVYAHCPRALWRNGIPPPERSDAVASCTTGKSLELTLTWPARGGEDIRRTAGGNRLPPPQQQRSPQKSGRISPEWKAIRNGQNLFRLDVCSLVTSTGETELMSISDAQTWLKDHDELPAAARFPFAVSNTAPLSEPLSVAIELGKGWSLSLNGAPVAMQPKGWLFDPGERHTGASRTEGGRERAGDQAFALGADRPPTSWKRRSSWVSFAQSAATTYRSSLPSPVGRWKREAGETTACTSNTGTVTYSATFEAGADATGATVLLPGLSGAAEVRPQRPDRQPRTLAAV